jgi:hypothetical protein
MNADSPLSIFQANVRKVILGQLTSLNAALATTKKPFTNGFSEIAIDRVAQTFSKTSGVLKELRNDSGLNFSDNSRDMD